MRGPQGLSPFLGRLDGMAKAMPFNESARLKPCPDTNRPG